MSDLKPCPFCGGKASIKGDRGLETLSCDDRTGDCPGSWVSLPCHRPERRAASIAAWNARAAAPAAPAKVPAFRTSFAYDVGFKDGQQAAQCRDPHCACRGGPCAECPEGAAIAAAPAAPAPVPLTDEQILRLVETHVGGPCPSYPLDGSDWINFARAAIAASKGEQA